MLYQPSTTQNYAAQASFGQQPVPGFVFVGQDDLSNLSAVVMQRSHRELDASAHPDLYTSSAPDYSSFASQTGNLPVQYQLQNFETHSLSPDPQAFDTSSLTLQHRKAIYSFQEQASVQRPLSSVSQPLDMSSHIIQSSTSSVSQSSDPSPFVQDTSSVSQPLNASLHGISSSNSQPLDASSRSTHGKGLSHP
jgi:hypothetical protein